MTIKPSYLSRVELCRRLIVISGPSGVGKSTAARLLERDHGVRLLRSITTRPMRHGETHGVDYLFWTRAQFDLVERAQGFVERAEIHGHRYGLAWRELAEALKAGPSAVVLSPSGLRDLRGHLPFAWGVWLEAPPRELRARMMARGDAPESIAARLEGAERWREEAAGVGYEYAVDATMPAPWVAGACKQILDAAWHRSLDSEPPAPAADLGQWVRVKRANEAGR